jgi:hypothetical protein
MAPDEFNRKIAFRLASEQRRAEFPLASGNCRGESGIIAKIVGFNAP